MRKIAIIPSLNPDDSFVSIAKEVVDAGLTLVVVNDGSKEECEHIFNEISLFATVLGYKENKGKGHALKYAFSYIKDKYIDEDYVVVTMDSDGQHKVSDALRVLKKAEDNPNCLILGSRKLDKSCPIKSRIGNFFARMTFTLFTFTRVYDTQTGLRAFNKNNIDIILNSKGERYEYEMNMLLDCVRRKIKIKEVYIEVIYIDNNSGSHYNPLKDTMKIFFELLKFSFSSLIGFIVDYSLYSLLLFIPLDKSYWLISSNIIARIISATINFSINYKLVFKSKDKLWKAALKYAALAIFILAFNTGILWLLVNKANINEFIAKIIVECIMFFVSWVIQRLFVFGVKKNVKA